jgi:hypothetical protein
LIEASLRARTSAGIVVFIRTSDVEISMLEGRIDGLVENLTPHHRKDMEHLIMASYDTDKVGSTKPESDGPSETEMVM